MKLLYVLLMTPPGLIGFQSSLLSFIPLLLILGIIAAIVVYFVRKKRKKIQINLQNPTENQSSPKVVPNKNPYLKWLIIIAVILVVTLPFHYVPGRMMMFPKNSFTFSYTIITEDDINNIIERYNDASFFEKQAINNEPIVRKLREKGIIADISSENSNN